MIIRNVTYYKIIMVIPTGLNVILKTLIFVFSPLVENLRPL